MAGRWLGVAACFLISCGGATPAPEEPSDAPVGEPEAVAKAPPDEVGEPPDESPGEEPGADTGAESGEPGATTLSDDELQIVMQQVLNDPDLDRYFHLDKPGRTPLKIHGAELPPKLKLTKGGQAVKIVDEPGSKKSAVLVFTRIARDGDSVRLRYEYDVEGIRGSAVVYLKGGKWRLGANRVIEK